MTGNIFYKPWQRTTSARPQPAPHLGAVRSGNVASVRGANGAILVNMKNKVLESFENDTGTHCLDIFMREDASFGFEEFRRDPEDQGDWQCLNKYGQGIFATGDAALEAAKGCVAWLDQAAGWRW